MLMDRGIVLSPKFIYRPTGDVLFESSVDDFELRKYLLYWDKINVPRSTYIDFDCDQFRLLQDAGRLERTAYGPQYDGYVFNLANSQEIYMRNIRFGGRTGLGKIDNCRNVALDRHVGEQILNAHNDVFMLLDAKEPGCWSKGQMSSSPITFDEKNERGVEINLYNLLPVPSADTSLLDIIKFKDSRHDELVAFRVYLDDLYQSIRNSQDPARAFNTEMNRLNLALIDLNKVMKESRFRVVVDSLRSVLNGFDGIVGLGLAAGTATTLTSALGVPPLVAGLSAAGLAIAPKLIPQSNSNIPSHFTYIKSVRSTFTH